MPQSEAVRLHFVSPVLPAPAHPWVESSVLAAVRSRFFELAAYQGLSVLRSPVPVILLLLCVEVEERLAGERLDELVLLRQAVEERLVAVVVALIARQPAGFVLILERRVRLCLAAAREGVAAERRDSAKVVLSVVPQPEASVGQVVPGLVAKTMHNWNCPVCSARQWRAQLRV